MPAEAAHDREVCRQLGIKSNLSIPLSLGGGPLIGVLGFNTTRAEHDWPDALVDQLQLIGQIFANALVRKRFELALRESEERLSLAADSAFGVLGAGLPHRRLLDQREGSGDLRVFSGPSHQHGGF